VASNTAGRASAGRTLIHLLAWQVLTWAVSFLFLIVGPRRLGSDALGAYAYSVAYVGFFFLLAGLGTNTLMVRDIARDRSVVSQYVFNATLLKCLTAIVVPVIGISLSWIIGDRGDRFILVLLGFVAMSFACIAEVAFGALNGLEIIAKPAFLGVVQLYIANGIGVLAIILGYGIVVYGVIVAIAAFVPLVASFALLRPHVHRPVHFDPALWRHLLRAGIPLMTLVIFNTIYGTIDVPILGAITNDATVGWYSVAYRWVGIPLFITTAVVMVYFPRFSAHGSPPTREFPTYVNQAIRLVMLAAVPCSLGLAMVADDLVHLIYNPDFYAAIPLIRILAFHIPLVAMDTLIATALIAANMHRRYMYVALSAAILNPIACVFAIQWSATHFGNGAIGAAIVTLATEAYILFGAARLRARGVLDRGSCSNLLRITAAGAVMMAFLFVVDTSPLLVQVISGAAIYGASLVVLRAVTIDEVRGLAARMPLGRRHRINERLEWES
jgi:O-antigen/teichoic acid export membrane protein